MKTIETNFYEILIVLDGFLHQSRRSSLRETIFLSLNVIFGGGTEVYSKPCQTSKMKGVAKTQKAFILYV